MQDLKEKLGSLGETLAKSYGKKVGLSDSAMNNMGQ